MDGRRSYSDDQEPRWRDEECGYGEPRWRERYDDDPAPPFDGFSAGGRADTERERHWSPPAADDYRDRPSWDSSAATLPADPALRRERSDTGVGYPGESVRPVSAGPARPVSGELPIADPPTGPVPPDALGHNAPTGVMPPVTPRDDGQRFHAEAIDRAALRRAPGPTDPVGDGVYRTRRPALALVYGILTVVFELVAIRIFLDAMFTGPLVISGVVSGMFLIAGLPLLGAGLYAATTGGARPDGADGLLRPPGLYLVAGLGLLIAAGLAA